MSTHLLSICPSCGAETQDAGTVEVSVRSTPRGNLFLAGREHLADQIDCPLCGQIYLLLKDEFDSALSEPSEADLNGPYVTDNLEAAHDNH